MTNCWNCASNETWNCNSNQTYCNWQCCTNPSYGIGGRGITYWGYHSGGMGAIIQPGQYAEFSFTCTEPKCYNSADSCNISFYAYPNGNSNNSHVPLGYYLNGVGGTGNDAFLSKVAGNGAWQATELVNIPNTPYHDRGLNIFRIYNHGDVAVTIEHLQVLRIYQMCNLEIEMAEGCSTPHGSVGGCSEGNEYSLLGNLDPTSGPYIGRQDFPCNAETCGGRSFTGFTFAKVGYTGYNMGTDQSGNRVIGANGGYLDVYFNFSSCSHDNYLQGDVCLFNFNPMYASSTSGYDDIKLEAYLNDSITPFATYYLSKQGGCGSAPSYNLMNVAGYNDSGPNHVRLVNRSLDVSVTMVDPFINIYRTYVSNVICGPGCSACQMGQGGGGQCSPCYLCYNVYCCQTCYGCESCNAGCTTCVECQDCQSYTCQEPCQIACQGCNTGCQTCVECQTIQVCTDGWYVCQGCETCQPCYGCQNCQTTCEVACQGCQIACQGCQMCVTCEIIQICNDGWYVCQHCETCQPAYA